MNKNAVNHRIPVTVNHVLVRPVKVKLNQFPALAVYHTAELRGLSAIHR